MEDDSVEHLKMAEEHLKWQLISDDSVEHLKWQRNT
jgi:hypothetical protein